MMSRLKSKWLFARPFLLVFILLQMIVPCAEADRLTVTAQKHLWHRVDRMILPGNAVRKPGYR